MLSAEACEARDTLMDKWDMNKTQTVERALIRAAARFAKLKVE